jgi:transposase
MSAGVIEVILSGQEARALTDQIKTGVEAVWHLITRAYTERAWTALGYRSWDDYCTREFGTSRLRLPREERAEVVASLRESGLSIPAIAEATGLGYGTVHREISGGYPNGQPEPEPSNVIGLDGKQYKPRPKPKTRPEPKTVEPEPETEEWHRSIETISYELGEVVEQLNTEELDLTLGAAEFLFYMLKGEVQQRKHRRKK